MMLQEKQRAMQSRVSASEVAATPMTYERFLVRLMRMLKENPSVETKKTIINALIHRVDIHETGFKLGFYIGAGQIKKGEALATPVKSFDKNFLSPCSFLPKSAD